MEYVENRALISEAGEVDASPDLAIAAQQAMEWNGDKFIAKCSDRERQEWKLKDCSFRFVVEFVERTQEQGMAFWISWHHDWELDEMCVGGMEVLIFLEHSMKEGTQSTIANMMSQAMSQRNIVSTSTHGILLSSAGPSFPTTDVSFTKLADDQLESSSAPASSSQPETLLTSKWREAPTNVALICCGHATVATVLVMFLLIFSTFGRKRSPPDCGASSI